MGAEIFIIIGAIGFAVLLLSFFVGDILEFDFFDSAFGLKSLAAFAAGFGIVGFGVSITNVVSLAVAVIAAVITGIICSAIVIKITKFLMRSESGDMSADDLIGQKGVVVNTIAPGSRGQVQVAHDGMNHIYSATGDTDLPNGTVVRLIKRTGLSTFSVVEASNPYDPINQTN